MYTRVTNTSIVTAILPEAYINRTLEALKQASYDVIHWGARGTLLDNRWFRKLVPVINPEKGVIRILLPNNEVDQAMHIILAQAHLDRQGTGAVYCTPCEELYIGGHFHSNCSAKELTESTAPWILKENLDIIHCIVAKDASEQIASAAIEMGAHGPIVHYSEGRGLRDRLGWLRITKQAEKEVLTVIVDSSEAEDMFAVMAHAGNLDLPGRGFMYQMPISKGLYNLPSHFDAHHHAANMQQIISAIDHLMGHEHWRDQTVFDLDGSGKSAGLDFIKKHPKKIILEQQVCLTAMVDREHADQIMDIMLDSGAPGLNTSYCQYVTSDNRAIHKGVKLIPEYGIIDCIVPDDKAHAILDSVKLQTEKLGIEDLCLYLQPIPKTITYIHEPRPEKRKSANELQKAVIK